MNKIGIIYLTRHYLLEFGTNCDINKIINMLISFDILNFDIIETPFDLETFKLLHHVK
jgi:predicted nucleotide-binding protein (sugar kinase/HSP70/actin superfamily)